jgi:hypothetical protein
VVDSAEAEKMFTDFFMADGRRREEGLVYLNLYDDRDRFLYQLSYDRDARRIMRGRTEAY